MQKAFKWLDANELAYNFHNYKDEGIDKPTLELWLKHLPLDKLLNTKSTTYRALTDAEKASVSNKSKAIALMMRNPSIIKRPVWDRGGKEFFLGWDADMATKLLAGNK